MLLAFIVIFMMFGLIAVYTYVSYASLRPKEGTICEGVTVEHVAGRRRSDADVLYFGYNIVSENYDTQL